MAVTAAAGIPGVLTNIAGMAPAYSLAMYRVTSMTTDATGDMLNVNGSASAMPMLDDFPGVAPTKYPARIPNSIARATDHEAISENAWTKPFHIRRLLRKRNTHDPLEDEFDDEQK